LANQRGGSECESTKILLEGDGSSNKLDPVGYPKSHAPHTTFRLPIPRSHWIATCPRNKHYQEPQLLHTRTAAGTTRKLHAWRGRLDRVWGVVRPPPPGNQEILRNTSSELQNSPQFHQQKSQVKAKIATRGSWRKPKLHSGA
jgi:hypothetical protein